MGKNEAYYGYWTLQVRRIAEWSDANFIATLYKGASDTSEVYASMYTATRWGAKHWARKKISEFKKAEKHQRAKVPVLYEWNWLNKRWERDSNV